MVRTVSIMMKVKSISEVSEGDFVSFRDLIRKGTEIFPKTFQELSERAKYLAFFYNDDGLLIGIGGLKVPKAEQRDKVFEKVRSSFEPNKFTSEIGWVRVEDGHHERGIEKEIVKELLDRTGKESVYSLLRADNAELVSILKEHKFRKTGTELPSSRGDYFFVLYARE
jgi:hypothetical protein